MISPTSLAAFSASIANGGIAGTPAARVQPTAARAAPPQAAPATPPLTQPSQKLPRGSLLNLTA